VVSARLDSPRNVSPSKHLVDVIDLEASLLHPLFEGMSREAYLALPDERSDDLDQIAGMRRPRRAGRHCRLRAYL
jgi:hypothetical protein